MKGTPREVTRLMYSMLTSDLITVIEEKKRKLVKYDKIMKSIGSTYLDWINHVTMVYKETDRYESYLDEIRYKDIPSDYEELAKDITYVRNDLEISYVGTGRDEGNILLTDERGNHILIYISASQFGGYGIMDVYTRIGRDIDKLYEDLY